MSEDKWKVAMLDQVDRATRLTIFKLKAGSSVPPNVRNSLYVYPTEMYDSGFAGECCNANVREMDLIEIKYSDVTLRLFYQQTRYLMEILDPAAWIRKESLNTDVQRYPVGMM